MAGGAGTRLWPLSTEARPKQFLPLLSPKTLLRETITSIVREGKDPIILDIAAGPGRYLLELLSEEDCTIFDSIGFFHQTKFDGQADQKSASSTMR